MEGGDSPEATPTKRQLTLADVEEYAEHLERVATFWKNMLKHDETQRLLDIDRLIHDLKVAHEIDGEILEVQCANIKYVNENPTSFHVFPEQSMRHLRKLQEKKEKNNLRLRRARDSIHLWHRVEKSVKAIMKQEKAEGQEDLKRMRRVLKRQEREAAAVGKKRKGTSTASGSR